eukprot:scaffold3767_cov116-Skeletonema_menzelii.AAC.11
MPSSSSSSSSSLSLDTSQTSGVAWNAFIGCTDSGVTSTRCQITDQPHWKSEDCVPLLSLIQRTSVSTKIGRKDEVVDNGRGVEQKQMIVHPNLGLKSTCLPEQNFSESGFLSSLLDLLDVILTSHYPPFYYCGEGIGWYSDCQRNMPSKKKKKVKGRGRGAAKELSKGKGAEWEDVKNDVTSQIQQLKMSKRNQDNKDVDTLLEEAINLAAAEREELEAADVEMCEIMIMDLFYCPRCMVLCRQKAGVQSSLNHL